MHAFTLRFPALLGMTLLLRLWLGARHIAPVQAHRDAVPAAFAASIPLDAHHKAADYTRAKTRLAMGEGAKAALGAFYHLIRH